MKCPSILPVLFALSLITSSVAEAQVIPYDWNAMRTPPDVKLKQLAVRSDTEVWALDSEGYAWLWNNVSWEKKACCVAGISVAKDGTLWATNPTDKLRVLKLDVANNKWIWNNIPTGMKQVTGVSATEAWGLDDANTLFKLNGAKWEKQDKGCCVEQISAGADGTPWGISSTSTDGEIMRWTGSGWGSLAGSGVFVSSGPKDSRLRPPNLPNVWSLDSSGRPSRLTGMQWTGYSYPHLFGLDKRSHLASISTGDSGDQGASVWGISRSGEVFKLGPIPQELCTQHVERVRKALETQTLSGPLGAYVPQCDKTGVYLSKQCHASTGLCWCVDPKTGVQVGEKSREENLTCPACLMAASEALVSKTIGAYIPQCDSTGNFKPLQEDVALGDRWCVDPKTGDKKGAVSKKGAPTPLCK